MPNQNIKSGAEVVKDFIASIGKNDELDSGMVAAIRELMEAGKLTRAQLLKALAEIRNR